MDGELLCELSRWYGHHCCEMKPHGRETVMVMDNGGQPRRHSFHMRRSTSYTVDWSSSRSKNDNLADVPCAPRILVHLMMRFGGVHGKVCT